MADLELLNSTALKLIDYRHEYLKSMSQVVRDALVTSLDVMIQQGMINKEIKMQILAENEGDAQLKALLESDQRFRKGPRQLYKDFEKIRAELDQELKAVGIVEFFESESSVADKKITVLRQYSLKKDFILEYFGLNEIDLIQLMKKRGFAEKFAVLRLNLIFDEILEEVKQDPEVSQGHSLVYYNPDITGFSIDFKYHVNISDLETDGGIKRIAKKIFDIDKAVDMKFKRKTGIDFYSKKAKRQEQKNEEVLKQNIKQVAEQQKPEPKVGLKEEPKEVTQKPQPKPIPKKEPVKQEPIKQEPIKEETPEKKTEISKPVSDIIFDDLEDFDV